MMDFSLLELLNIPIFWVNQQGIICWSNSSASAIVNLAENDLLWLDVCNHLPPGYIYRLHENIHSDEKGMLVECLPDANPDFIHEVQRLQAANEELEKIFNASFDEVFVTDGKGVTIRVNEAVERLYGLERSELIGKSVFELERKRIFYPSVTAMVLRERKRQTIIQTTGDGRRLITTGNPIFGQNGEIIQVISNAKDISDVSLALDQAKFLQGTSIATMSSTNESVQDQLIATSPATREVLKLVEKVKSTDTSILLLGETGVGKNRIAEFIHQSGHRSQGRFIHIDCASIPETLLESELFGYEKGAFTGANREGKLGNVEFADGGTLFLDEIGELPLNLQGKLLNFIQKRTFTRIGGSRLISVNTRIIAATNRNLEQMVTNGLFRADLYYRLNVIPMFIPPLRERTGDILALTDLLLSKFARYYQQHRKALHPATRICLEAYAWPGNIRQLENLIERLVITVDDEILMPEHLPQSMITNPTVNTDLIEMETCPVQSTSPLHRFTLHEQIAQYERKIFEKALQEFPSTYAIAKELEVSQPTVVRKLKQFHLR